MGRYVVVVSGPDMVEDIRQANDDQLSFRDAVAEVNYTYSGLIVGGGWVLLTAFLDYPKRLHAWAGDTFGSFSYCSRSYTLD